MRKQTNDIIGMEFDIGNDIVSMSVSLESGAAFEATYGRSEAGHPQLHSLNLVRASKPELLAEDLRNITTSSLHAMARVGFNKIDEITNASAAA